jgi:Uma2 family endonuclease
MSATLTDTSKSLTLQEFLDLPEGDITYELRDGQAIAKMSPKRIHSCLQRALLMILSDWGNDDNSPLAGDAYPEWAICLQRNETDWCPVPDVTYISDAKLADIDLGNEACPVPPELVVEILSPGQSFEEMTQKALDYLAAGVQRVWIVSDRERSLTIFAPDSAPMTYRGDQPIQDDLFPQLMFTINELFTKAKI